MPYHKKDYRLQVDCFYKRIINLQIHFFNRDNQVVHRWHYALKGDFKKKKTCHEYFKNLFLNQAYGMVIKLFSALGLPWTVGNIRVQLRESMQIWMNNPEYVVISNLKRLLGKYYKLQTFNTLYSDSCSLCTIDVNICTPFYVSSLKQIYCARATFPCLLSRPYKD